MYVCMKSACILIRSVLQCGAVCCSAEQCVAVRVLQYIDVCVHEERMHTDT